MRRRPLLCLAVLGCLAGCQSLAPDPGAPALELPGAFARAGTDPAAASSAAIRPDWWTLYGDPALDALVRDALARNADIRIAVARIEELDANLREANAAVLPEVSLAGGATRSRVSARNVTPIPAGVPLVRNDLQIAARTSFELDFWGRLRSAVTAARAQNLATRHARDTVALTLTGVVVQAWFSLRSLDAQLALTRATLALREENERLVRQRVDSGIGSELDLNLAQGARADIALQLADLVRQRELLEHQLGVLTGRLDLAVPAGDLRTLPLPPAPPPGLPSTLLTRRPDIAQAEQTLAAANAQVGVARAEQLPLFSLTASLGSQSAALPALLTSPAGIWSLGLAATAPLFDSGRREARTDAALARAEQARASYRRTVEVAVREVADALTSLQQAAASEQDVRAKVVAARNAERLSRLRYEAGYSGYLEFLDAQRTANDAELALVRNRQAMLAAHVDLAKALGGGWSARGAAGQDATSGTGR